MSQSAGTKRSTNLKDNESWIVRDKQEATEVAAEIFPAENESGSTTSASGYDSPTNSLPISRVATGIKTFERKDTISPSAEVKEIEIDISSLSPSSYVNNIKMFYEKAATKSDFPKEESPLNSITIPKVSSIVSSIEKSASNVPSINSVSSNSSLSSTHSKAQTTQVPESNKNGNNEWDSLVERLTKDEPAAGATSIKDNQGQ